jgi:curved DNA-binding protein CbpA
MQFNGKFLNPYEVLGLPWASDSGLVKATFKSLVKIYHPDVFRGDKNFAKERLAQLNAAYEFLSDSEQKREFDKSSQSRDQDEGQQDFDPERNSSEFDEGINILKENWDFACEYYPELKRLYSNLRKISREPAFAFMAFVVETKEYAQAKSIAKTLEDEFLTAKFSSDKKIKQIAKQAILQKEIRFAQELNRALKILGPQSAEAILSKLSGEFPNFASVAYSNAGLEHILSKQVRTEIDQRKEAEKVRAAAQKSHEKDRMEAKRIQAAQQRYQEQLEKKKKRKKEVGSGEFIIAISLIIAIFCIGLAISS